MGAVIRNPGAVYRSTNPEHLKLARENDEATCAMGEAANALAAELVPGGVAYGARYDDGTFAMYGVLVTHRDIDPPAGMRWDTKAKGGALVMVPAKRTDEGKAIDKRMAQTARKLNHLGPVSEVLIFTDGELRWFGQGVIEVVGSTVYATYHHPLDDERSRGGLSDRQRVEQSGDWEPVPLSEFYAAREAEAS